MKKNFLPQMFGALILTTVVLVAGCKKDDDVPPNQNPVISAVTVNPTSAAAGGTVAVSVTASDPDGDALTYAYTVSGGAISGSGASATWTTPSAGGAYSVTVTVTDGKGGSASGNGSLTVTGGTAQITQITGTASFPAGTGGDLGNAKVSIYNNLESWYNESPAAFGIVTGSGASVTFTLPVAVPGIYYFDVWKDNDGNGSFSSGDFYGWQGPGNINDGVTQPAQFSIGQGQSLNFNISMVTVAAQAQVTQITGTASFPAGTGGDLGNAKVSIYNNLQSWENESPEAFGVVTGSGASVTFTLPVAVPGIYYFDVWKDNDGNGSLSSGDYYGWQGPGNYNDGTQPAQFSIGQGQTLNFTVNMITILGVEEQYPDGTVHCVAPTAIVDVTNPTTGKIWMDRNLGATQVATSSTDQDAYGDLYQWGRRGDGHQCRTSSTTWVLSSTDQPANGSFIQSGASPDDWRSPQNSNLWQGVNGVNNPCPSGYRLPTNTELNAERLSWSSNNAAGAFNSPLKLTVTGHRSSVASFFAVGSFGYYWSSTVAGTGSYGLVSFPDNANMYGIGRAYGLAVRCLKN